MNRKYMVMGIILVVCFFACSKDIITASFPGFQAPSHFPAPQYNFSLNPVTKEGFELGRKIFYDPILSADNTISCGSCHVQTSAFTHHGHAVSHGIHDRRGTRNSPPIMNLAWSTAFMWDGGIFDLDLQAIAPITNHAEMDETMENVLRKLRNTGTYPPLFKKAFATEEITAPRFLKSLSQFMVMCISSNCKYDSVKQNIGVLFTKDEQKGYALFVEKCATCHREPLFTDNSFRNNGISVSNVNDEGRYTVTQIATDKYRFKVPSLRNLAFTGPYMHDGRFLTLEAVLDHYTTRVSKTPNLDPQLENEIDLSTQERKWLLAFLSTLNDKSFLTDKRFSEP